mmetsp:Transcript_104/g.291  ORF Transcript_104/g.291 Transcript_104/m.291 type:complete len:382 (+) Transcript_104:1004-2149(+)
MPQPQPPCSSSSSSSNNLRSRSRSKKGTFTTTSSSSSTSCSSSSSAATQGTKRLCWSIWMTSRPLQEEYPPAPPLHPLHPPPLPSALNTNLGPYSPPLSLHGQALRPPQLLMHLAATPLLTLNPTANNRSTHPWLIHSWVHCPCHLWMPPMPHLPPPLCPPRTLPPFNQHLLRRPPPTTPLPSSITTFQAQPAPQRSLPARKPLPTLDGPCSHLQTRRDSMETHIHPCSDKPVDHHMLASTVKSPTQTPASITPTAASAMGPLLGAQGEGNPCSNSGSSNSSNSGSSSSKPRRLGQHPTQATCLYLVQMALPAPIAWACPTPAPAPALAAMGVVLCMEVPQEAQNRSCMTGTRNWLSCWRLCRGRWRLEGRLRYNQEPPPK